LAIAPVEIRHVTLKKSFFGGYRKKRVNELLDDVAQSFEEVWREREDLRYQVHQLETELRRHRELESLLRETLVTAEKSVIELKDQARTEAELVVREAHTAARSITLRPVTLAAAVTRARHGSQDSRCCSAEAPSASESVRST